MKKNSLLLIFGITLSLIGCKSYKVDETGIDIAVSGGNLRIDVMNPSCFHIVKLKEGDTLSSPRYAVVAEPAKTSFSVYKEEGKTVLSTQLMNLLIGKDGLIEYRDKSGKFLLAELPDTLAAVPDSLARYAVSQSFTCGEEAVYGLGQYQDGLMNFKNVPLRLKQFNQIIAVPFMVSTNHYGILWDNEGITDFNPPSLEIRFDSLVDEKANIRKAWFTPRVSGLYSFFMESPNPEKNRFRGPVLLTAGGDTIIHYETIWVPDCLSGQAYLETGERYEMTFQNSNSQTPGKILYNRPDYDKSVFSSYTGEGVDYYFVYGEDPSAVIHGYRMLTGRAPMFSKPVYGFWQCRERYHTQQELLENARGYRERNIPADNIVQDWNYWPEGTWGPEWDHSRYPDPAGMCDELADMNLNLMVSVWPRIENEALEEKYDLGNYKYPHSTYLDFFNPEVRKNYYRMLKDSMFNLGVDYIWLDGTEPEQYPQEAETWAGPFDRVADAYSLMVTRSVYEGKRKDYPGQRVFNLTRSAFAGQQRYGAASWSGDVLSSWEQLSEQIPGGLNFCMAGIPYWTTDIGGFFRDTLSLNPHFNDQYQDPEYIELLSRWFEYGTFCPVFRIHGYKSKTEIWRYGKNFENLARKYIGLRYRLLPYIYSEAWQVTSAGRIMMRPLSYEYPADAKTWNIKDQFFFGRSLMVCPVTRYQARNRRVYLPSGVWYDFRNGEKITGGREVTVPAPLDDMPVFVRGGSIIPLGPRLQYALEKSSQPVEIRIYPGADADFALYLDDGNTNEYLNGNYSVIRLSYSEKTSTLVIGGDEGSFVDYQTAPLQFIVTVTGKDVRKEISYDGNREEISL